jgi:hypothetical protein
MNNIAYFVWLSFVILFYSNTLFVLFVLETNVT